MNDFVLRHWWLLTLRGALAVLFGVLAIGWPAITVLVLATLFAAFALLAGVVWIFEAVQGCRGDPYWWRMLLLGMFSMGAGMLAASDPGLTTLALVLIMGLHALVSGVFDIVFAVRLRRQLHGEWLLVLSGTVAIVFGLLVLLFPAGAGVLALAWITGCYALATGVLQIALSLRVRAWSALNPLRDGRAGARENDASRGKPGESADGLP